MDGQERKPWKSDFVTDWRSNGRTDGPKSGLYSRMSASKNVFCQIFKFASDLHLVGLMFWYHISLRSLVRRKTTWMVSCNSITFMTAKRLVITLRLLLCNRDLASSRGLYGRISKDEIFFCFETQDVLSSDAAQSHLWDNSCNRIIALNMPVICLSSRHVRDMLQAFENRHPLIFPHSTPKLSLAYGKTVQKKI